MKTLIAALLLVVGACALDPRKVNIIDGEYLVGLDETIVKTTNEEDAFVQYLADNFNIELKKFFHIGSLKLLYVLADQADIQKVAELPEVKYIDQNAYAHGSQLCTEQPSPQTWGLDRIDQTEQLLYNDPLFNGATYSFGDRTGSNVVAYIADTGIDWELADFGGRASWGYNAPGMGTDDKDNHGHGTHCAGTVGSNSYGVAKDVTLVGVKVLDQDASGPWSSIIDGMEWILDNHNQRGVTLGYTAKSVINLSLGGLAPNQGVKSAVENLIGAGVVAVVAAMNEETDACTYTPADVPDALTIGASDVQDVAADFTNYGECVDLFGPGVTIMSTYPGGSATMSGTSMATPHVAGVVARYMSAFADDDVPTPTEVDSWIKSIATQDALTFNQAQSGSPNLLLYADCTL